MEDPNTTPPLRLSELAAAVSAAVTRTFAQQRFWVVADVTSHTFKADNNYHYFDLVEKDPVGRNLVARLSAKAWGQGSLSIGRFQRLTGQRFTNNIHVLVCVSVQYHAVYGLQLNLHEIDPAYTLGLLESQRRETLERLAQENPEDVKRAGDAYETYNKRLSLPRVLQRLAVISSKTSAGWQDFRHTLDNNPYGYGFFVDDYFTVVQGEANVDQFVDRLLDVFRSHKIYDAVVIIRGGGSQTDFLLFDHYEVGKAIARFPIPVITGIGHQKDETIADLMAHLATKTPTKAAEFIINRNRAYEDALAGLQHMIAIRSQQRFGQASRSLGQLHGLIVNKTRDIVTDQRERLNRNSQLMLLQTRSILYHRNGDLAAIASRVSTGPGLLVLNKLKDLQQTVSNLRTFKTMYLKDRAASLELFVTVIRLVSPENTLRRGFAIIKTDGRVTGDPRDLEVGKSFEILLRNKEITSIVISKNDYHGIDFNL